MSGKIIDVSDNLNYSGDKGAEYPSMQVYKDELYCVWKEQNANNSIYQIKVKKYDGNNWSSISSSLNYDSSKDAHSPVMQVYKDKLYCVWKESNQIKMKKYDGNSWLNVSSCLNYDANRTTGYPNLQVYNNELYCAWYESSGPSWQIKIKKYNGVSWEEIPNNLNYSENGRVAIQTLQVYKNNLYCIWREENGSNGKIKLKKHDGNSWINISNNLNYDKNKNASWPTMQVYNDELYCAWEEYNGSNYQIKIKKHNSEIQKFLIKQNNKYFSVKPEFYKNGQYQTLTLDGDMVPNDNDFINNGFDDLDDLCKEISVENNIIKVKSNASNYEEGKLFSFNIDSEFKNINNIE